MIKEEVILSSRAWLECQFCHLQIWVNTSPPKPQNVLLSAGDLVFRVLAAAAAKLLQSCLTLCDPVGGSHQAPPSLGFSRQEHWSGLPFPSPMHESEKWKWSRSVLSLTLSNPMDCSLPGSSGHGILQARVLEWGASAFSVLRVLGNS